MPLLVEPRGGMTRLTALGAGSPPCNFIVDRHERIRGRAFGPAKLGDGPAPAIDYAMTAAEPAQVISGAQKSIWASPAAADFVTALISPALA